MVSAHQSEGGGSQHAANPRFDVRVLEQGRTWVDRDGRRHPLAAMTVAELEDVISYLRAHRDVFYLLVLRREVSLRLLAVSPALSERSGPTSLEHDDQDHTTTQRGGPRLPGAPGVSEGGRLQPRERPHERRHDRRRDRLWFALGQGPAAWLDATALMRALKRGVHTRSSARQ